VAQGIIYFKRSDDRDALLEVMHQEDIPVERFLLHGGVDVCRDDLLVEIELMAVLKGGSRAPQKMVRP
jgi:hypothetical protein